jgi:hypothetical protein
MVIVLVVAMGPKQWPEQPTAQALLAEVAVTPLSAPTRACAGLATRFHVLPFHCKITVCGLVELRKQSAVQPTAQALCAETAATLLRELFCPGLGLGTRFQVVPFQCKISVLIPPKPWKQFPAQPTAQALLAEVAATPNSAPPSDGVGLGTCFQVLPFQCRICVLPGGVSLPPTAQALLAEVAEVAVTAYRAPPPDGVGLGTRAQTVPFQRRMIVLPLELTWPTAQALCAEVAATPKSWPEGNDTARSGIPVPAVAWAAVGTTAPAVPATTSEVAPTTIHARVNFIDNPLQTGSRYLEPDPPCQIRRQQHPSGCI